MTRMPSVSVIIPCYNYARFLECAVYSVLAQTFADWEAIIVDDGSTDDTALVVAGLNDPRIKYIFQQNRGLSAARNTGISAARADLIALLDADDYWHPDFLHKMVPLLWSFDDAAAAYCGYHVVDESGKVVRSPEAKTVRPELFYETMVCEGNWLAPAGVVFRKAAAEEVGMFDETLRALEDADLWERLSRRRPFIGLSEALVYYRRHHTNMSNDHARMISSDFQKSVKAFGPPDGSPSSWAPLKRRAFARVFRTGVSRYLADGNLPESASFYRKLLWVSPDEALSDALWVSLALAQLPWERQNRPTKADLATPVENVLSLLQALSQQHTGEPVSGWPVRRVERAAYLGLARLGLEIDDRLSFIRWFGLTTAKHPTAIFSLSYWRVVKLLIAGVIRQLSRAFKSA
ncbi:MAG: glycosyltransferase family 2 protein [Phycisphaerales bacterium]|nr:glycosyltransferase family 2 protein [Phycisphaerales bacterium]